MSALPVDIVRRLLENAADPAIITELVADEATCVSLDNDDEELHRIVPWAGTKHGLQAFQDDLRGVSTFWADPAGEPFEI